MLLTNAGNVTHVINDVCLTNVIAGCDIQGIRNLQQNSDYKCFKCKSGFDRIYDFANDGEILVYSDDIQNVSNLDLIYKDTLI